jgi:hypothetical protein
LNPPRSEHEINVAPMENYIEGWFKKEIDKLTKEGKETVETVPIIVNEDNKRTKKASEDTINHHGSSC